MESVSLMNIVDEHCTVHWQDHYGGEERIESSGQGAGGSCGDATIYAGSCDCSGSYSAYAADVIIHVQQPFEVLIKGFSNYALRHAHAGTIMALSMRFKALVMG